MIDTLSMVAKALIVVGLIMLVSYSTSIGEVVDFHFVAAISHSASVGGFLSGSLHALTGPDHIAILLPLIFHKRWYYSCMYGIVWGFGHGVTSVMIGSVSFFMKSHVVNLNDIFTQYRYIMDCMVGVTLILIGVMGIMESREGEEEEKDKEVVVTMNGDGSTFPFNNSISKSISNSGHGYDVGLNLSFGSRHQVDDVESNFRVKISSHHNLEDMTSSRSSNGSLTLSSSRSSSSNDSKTSVFNSAGVFGSKDASDSGSGGGNSGRPPVCISSIHSGLSSIRSALNMSAEAADEAGDEDEEDEEEVETCGHRFKEEDMEHGRNSATMTRKSVKSPTAKPDANYEGWSSSHLRSKHGLAYIALFVNGAVLGVSWDGLPSLAPSVVLDSYPPLVMFLAAYLAGTVAMMGIASGALGEATCFIARLSSSGSDKNTISNEEDIKQNGDSYDHIHGISMDNKGVIMTDKVSNDNTPDHNSSNSPPSPTESSHISAHLAYMSSVTSCVLGGCYILLAVAKYALLSRTRALLHVAGNDGTSFDHHGMRMGHDHDTDPSELGVGLLHLAGSGDAHLFDEEGQSSGSGAFSRPLDIAFGCGSVLIILSVMFYAIQKEYSGSNSASSKSKGRGGCGSWTEFVSSLWSGFECILRNTFGSRVVRKSVAHTV